MEQYQKHIPDLRKNTSEKKTRIRPPPVQSSSESDAESESESSDEDYIPPVVKMKEKSHTSENTTQEVKTDSGNPKKEVKGERRTHLPRLYNSTVLTPDTEINQTQGALLSTRTGKTDSVSVEISATEEAGIKEPPVLFHQPPQPDENHQNLLKSSESTKISTSQKPHPSPSSVLTPFLL